MKKRRVERGDTYTVVWDGRVDGADSDLLDPSLRLPVKHQSVPQAHLVLRQAYVRRAIDDVRDLLRREGGLRVLEIRARLGLGDQTTRTALYQLLCRGELLRNPTDLPHRGRPGLVYRLAEPTVAIQGSVPPCPTDAQNTR